jgi:hypothetical protein
MGLSDAKSNNGVMIVRVEGQLVVGNRNELKEHLQGLLERVSGASSSTSRRPDTSTRRASAPSWRWPQGP